jgi:hypothetical protein
METSWPDRIGMREGCGIALRRFIIHTVFKYVARRPASR